MLSKILLKSNGRIEIFEKKIHGKEVSHDKVKPLLRPFGQGGGGGLYSFCIGCPPPPAWLASVVVRPYHVAQKLEHLFTKDNNDTNILTVKFSLHFTQKYYPVHLDDLDKSLTKYGSLSCYLAASVVYELRGKIQMVHYGIYVPMSA